MTEVVLAQRVIDMEPTLSVLTGRRYTGTMTAWPGTENQNCRTENSSGRSSTSRAFAAGAGGFRTGRRVSAKPATVYAVHSYDESQKGGKILLTQCHPAVLIHGNNAEA